MYIKKKTKLFNLKETVSHKRKCASSKKIVKIYKRFNNFLLKFFRLKNRFKIFFNFFFLIKEQIKFYKKIEREWVPIYPNQS